MQGINLLKIWHWIMQERRENNYANSNIKYLRKNMYIISWLTYLHIQHWFSWKIFGRIRHCVTVVGKWIFDSDLPFALPLTKDKLDYCCINDNKTKGMNGYKGILKAIRVFTKENDNSVIQNWRFITGVW